MLCACAEYWLPDGVDNAMELIQQKEDELDDQDEEELIMAEKKNSEDEKESSNVSPVNGKDDTVDRRTPTNITGGVDGDKDVSEVGGKNHTASSELQDNPTTPANSSVDGDDGEPSSSSSFHSPPRQVVGNATSSWIGSSEDTPLTPPNATRQPMTLSPPSPPGRRWLGGLQQRLMSSGDTGGSSMGRGVRPIVGSPRPHVRRIRPSTPGISGSIPPSLRTPPPTSSNPLAMIPPSPLEYQGGVGLETRRSGRYVPHVVIVSLNTLPLPNSDGGDENGEVDDDTANVSGYPAHGANTNGNKRRRGRYQRPRLGQLLEACPLEEKKASGVTCVKFSPCANYCLLGYGVRESSLSPDDDDDDGAPTLHPATALYRVQGGMTHVSSMLSADDDVNIARFHPDSGHGFVYGTKQGRVRILSPRPWNYYHT
eukprot:scaffold22452_cov54-Attheya_sp.AAC.2